MLAITARGVTIYLQALSGIIDPWPTTTYIIHAASGAATEIDTERPL